MKEQQPIITIQEDYKLPSKGLIYAKPFDPIVKLRSMTVAEEMKRLTQSKNPYMVMSDIIEDCLLTKLPIKVYDLCLGDYQYLLHRLRVVTYGPDYRIQYRCPKCGAVKECSINLDELKINEYTNDIEKLKTVTLPSGKEINLRFQTPRDLDRIANKAAEMKKEFAEMKGDPTYPLTLASLVDTIDGEKINQLSLVDEMKKLPMNDARILIEAATKLTDKVGIDTIIDITCDTCNNEVKVPFRFTNEFFGPTGR